MTKMVGLKVINSTVIAVLAWSAIMITPVIADENPFQRIEIIPKQMVADHHGKHCKIKKMDTDGDGSVSKEEFMSYSETKFKHKDKNGDGILSNDELKHHSEGRCDKGKYSENPSS